MSNETKEHNCGHNLVDWDGNGNCITCARDKIADPLGDMFEAMGVKVVDVTPKVKGNESVRFRTDTQTEPDLTEIWSVMDRFVDSGHISDDGIDAISNAISSYTEKAVREARIESLEWALNDYNMPDTDTPKNLQGFIDELREKQATLKKGDKDE